MRYIRYQVTCSIDVVVGYQLSMYLTLAIFGISAQKPFLWTLVENDLEILGMFSNSSWGWVLRS